MICRKCGRSVPDNLLACPSCVEERNDAALRQYQHHPLRLLATGRGIFTTRSINQVRHIQMFGCQRTFCGEAIETHHRRNTQAFHSLHDVESHICAKCREQISEILKEATACSAQA